MSLLSKLSFGKKDDSKRSEGTPVDDGQLDSLVRQGYAAQMAGEMAKAEQCYQRILQLQPDHYDALYLLGKVAHSGGDHERAVELLRKAVALRPGEVAFHALLATALEAAARHEEAISSYQAVLALDPGDAQAANNLGCIFRDQGDIGKARECFETAIRVQPGLVEAHYNLGNILREFGDPRRAIEHFRAALATQPGHAKVWNDLGCAFQVLGRLEEAGDAFRRAVGEDPDYGIGYKNLAGALRELGRLGEAVQIYERALHFFPLDPAISHYLGALRDTNPERASVAYVKEMFDAFAQNFDETLVNRLHYRTPPLLFDAVCHALGQASPPQTVLDMGCGSGLFGVHARTISRELIGIDLSAEMIKKAGERGCYDRLEVCDLLDFLEKAPRASFDLAAAVDVLVYFGNLSEIFERTRTVLKIGGIFAYSVEADLESGRDFRLRSTGRYCHTRRYLQGLAREHGFAPVSFSQAVLREDKGVGVEGYICALRRIE
jgi:predicted TPR repeat methyltransferase